MPQPQSIDQPATNLLVMMRLEVSTSTGDGSHGEVHALRYRAAWPAMARHATARRPARAPRGRDTVTCCIGRLPAGCRHPTLFACGDTERLGRTRGLYYVPHRAGVGGSGTVRSLAGARERTERPEIDAHERRVWHGGQILYFCAVQCETYLV